MTFVRTLAVWLIGLPITIALFFLVLLTVPFERQGRAIHSIGAFWSRILIGLAGIRVEVRGMENIPRGVPVVLLSNHQGAFDIPALQAFLPLQFRWVAKKSLFKIPIIGWSMSLANYIPIERENPQEAMKSMEEASVRIKNGTSVLVFPEGTRSETGALLPFKRGAFMLATKSGAAIVPVAIKGTSAIMKKGGFLIRPSRVTIAVGKPILPQESDEKDLRNRTKRAIEALFNEGVRAGA